MEDELVGANALKEEFRDLPTPEQFPGVFESFAEKTNRFAVLVVRIDDFITIFERLGENITSNLLVRVGRIIESMSRTSGMTWGRLRHEEFACLCQDVDEPKGLELAEEIRNRVQIGGEETVSIGLAVFPFWPFEKTTVLDNAQKALDHAAFFGPNTVTPFDAVSLNISADKLYQYGDIEGAIEEFKKALAVNAFETAIRFDPTDVMATFNLGLAHIKQGDQEKALELFLHAHELDEDNPEVAYQIGVCHQEKGETDPAIEFLEKAAANSPKGAHVFRALGECYLKKEMHQEAAKAYEKVIRLNPTDAKSLSTLGYLYGVIGENLEIAIVLCRESTKIDPDNSLYRYRLGKLYQQSQDYENAVKELKIAAD
ncbi:MAG: tetratricopeptide repeat protein, partial [Deltaproteobacteria bacterium]|nr:tetratricopeptide repeat protein [Deltaproteobacteria bacterium]